METNLRSQNDILEAFADISEFQKAALLSASGRLGANQSVRKALEEMSATEKMIKQSGGYIVSEYDKAPK
jgi:hypothetical protein